MKYAYPSMGMYISPFEKFKVEPQLLKTLEKKDSQAAEMLNAFEPYQLMVHPKARKDQLNVWKIIVPALDPITRESGSLSSAL